MCDRLLECSSATVQIEGTLCRWLTELMDYMNIINTFSVLKSLFKKKLMLTKIQKKYVN